MDVNEKFNPNLLEKLGSENELLKAETEEQAPEHLSDPELKAVLVADGAIGDYKHRLLRDCLVEFVKDGGTVVHACSFSSTTTFPAFDRYFKHGWGVGWKVATYTGGAFRLKKSGALRINRKKLPAPLYQKAIVALNVSAQDALYLEENVRQPADNALCESPVAFTKIESGFMGFVGDAGHTEESDRVIFAMFGMD